MTTPLSPEEIKRLDEHRRLLAEAKCLACDGTGKMVDPDFTKSWPCDRCNGTGRRFPTLSTRCFHFNQGITDKDVELGSWRMDDADYEQGEYNEDGFSSCNCHGAGRIPIPTNSTAILEALRKERWWISFKDVRLRIKHPDHVGIEIYLEGYWEAPLDAAIYAAAVAVLEGEKS